MKSTSIKTSILLLVIAAPLLFFCTPAIAALLINDDDNDNEEIIVLPDIQEGGSYTRAQAIIPITATFVRDQSLICLEILFPIENLSVRLTNLSTGQTISYPVGDATDFYIPVSLGTGPYRIDFLINNGTYYYGYFNN